MSEAIPDQLKLIEVRSTFKRALLLLPVALALVGCWYAARWYLGNEMASVAPEIEQNALSIAQTAVRFAPDDPWTHWVVADLDKQSFEPDQLTEAVRQYEAAARLSPNDYRWWMSLGSAREQAGDSSGGETALRRAVELAPAYFWPRWYLGNLLLRQGRGDEAFAELRRAGDANPAQRPQVFNLAWQIYGEDIQKFNAVIGNSAEARAQLASYLVGRERASDGLRVWSSLNEAEKKEQRATGQTLLTTLLATKRYHAALEIARDIAPDKSLVPEIGQFVNGGFEKEVGASGNASVFGWQVKPVAQVQIAIDPRQRRGGARSLRIVFNSPSTLLFNNISQLVPVEASTPYRFECSVRTQDLKSAGTPIIQIVDAMDENRALATSTPLANGNNEWQPITLDFKTPPQTEAVIFRISRASCSESAGGVCPIFGMVWYDDFNLQRAGASNAARDTNSAGSSARAKNRSAR